MSYAPDPFLQTFGAHPALLERLARAFQVEGPRQLQRLRDAVAGGDPGQIEQAAHTLKGAVANYLYPELVEALEELEQRAVRRDLNGMAAELVAVEQMVDSLVGSLSGLLQQV